MADLRYQRVVLLVPWEPGATSAPEEWDWQEVADTPDAITVLGAEDVPPPNEIVDQLDWGTEP